MNAFTFRFFAFICIVGSCLIIGCGKNVPQAEEKKVNLFERQNPTTPRKEIQRPADDSARRITEALQRAANPEIKSNQTTMVLYVIVFLVGATVIIIGILYWHVLQKNWCALRQKRVKYGMTLENLQETPQATISITEEIQKLSELYSNGVITQEEFERGKSLFLGAPKDKSQQTLETLSNLYQLMKRGAISENEYNMTKWELLAGKLMK